MKDNKRKVALVTAIIFGVGAMILSLVVGSYAGPENPLITRLCSVIFMCVAIMIVAVITLYKKSK